MARSSKKKKFVFSASKRKKYRENIIEKNPFHKKEEPLPESRTIFYNHKVPDGIDDIPPQRFATNEIKTSKYTIPNFLPKSLFEQFRRIANFYFLCLVIIHFSIDSPVSPWTSLLPLLFVVIVTGTKQGYEDWKRHKEDKKINNKITHILHEGEIREIEQSKICVGDIVKVETEEEFPCDLLLINAPHPEGKCDVTTANLDGETNLKSLQCPSKLKILESEEDLLSLISVIECQQPTTNLYEFKGRMEICNGPSESSTLPLNIDNFLPRGAKLKNISHIYGCAIYTGRDTKISLNSKIKSNKFSTIEKKMNYYLLCYLVVEIFEVFLCTLLKYQVYDLNLLGGMWYLGDIDVSKGPSLQIIIEDSFSFLILYSYLIPISLYVTLEMQKFFSTFFFQWDRELRCPKTGEPPICNTSDLNEELGQVQYLFTDKTGTLTENIMSFRQCSVGGVKFFDGTTALKSVDEESFKPLPCDIYNQIESFLLTLALCHTAKAKRVPVSPDKYVSDNEDEIGKEDGIELMEFKWDYMASSPDEKALVEACQKFGIIYEGEKNQYCYVRMQDKVNVYKRLDVLEFDSDRKRMSVIVQDAETNEIWLLTKGAEISVLKQCQVKNEMDEMIKEFTLKHIDDFAMLGLRTLAIARKKLKQEEYDRISLALSRARQLIDGREKAVRKEMNNIESDLTLQGATGVEDLLQEGVPETLESLFLAGIKVWVLTGDKVETAINIAHLCGLFKKFMTILSLTHLDSEDLVHMKLKECGEESKSEDVNFGLVVDGTSLLFLLDSEYSEEFYKICTRCSAVICCRMSPQQKAKIVRMVKVHGGSKVVCAAIGDGANDVSMIQEAHIGLGLVGKEGRQAVMCSDFGFSRFRYLKRVLLMHGHWFYMRATTLVQYCFYKNVAFITPQLFYTFACAYSTQSIYEGMALTMYNTTYTALPIVILGLFDQNFDEKTLLDKPFLYKTIVGNKNMTWKIFITWGLLGLWHAFVLFFGLYGVSKDDTSGLPDGRTPDLYAFGMVLTSLMVFVTTFKLLIEARSHNIVFISAIVLSLLFYDVFNLIYEGVFPLLPIFWVFYVIHTSWNYFFTFVLLTVLSLLPDAIIRIYHNTRFNKKYHLTPFNKKNNFINEFINRIFHT